MPRTPTEAEVRASIRAEIERRNAAVTPAQRSAAIRERERGYGAEGSPYAETPEQKRKRLEAEKAAQQQGRYSASTRRRFQQYDAELERAEGKPK